MKKEVLLKAQQSVKSLDRVIIGTVDQYGFPRASAISLIKFEGLKKAFFATGLDSGKVRCLKQNKKACICYQPDDDNVTVIGEIDILTDQETKELLWQDWFIGHFPGGPSDPNYCVLKFTGQKGVLWFEKNYFEFGNEELSDLEA